MGQNNGGYVLRWKQRRLQRLIRQWNSLFIRIHQRNSWRFELTDRRLANASRSDGRLRHGQSNQHSALQRVVIKISYPLHWCGARGLPRNMLSPYTTSKFSFSGPTISWSEGITKTAPVYIIFPEHFIAQFPKYKVLQHSSCIGHICYSLWLLFYTLLHCTHFLVYTYWSTDVSAGRTSRNLPVAFLTASHIL